jgi:phosphate transport system substrate-binding protein
VETSANGRRGRTRRTMLYGCLVIAAVGALIYVRRDADGTAMPTGSLQISGSETMRGLVAVCAEQFMSSNHQADVMVRGGSSGDGIAALLHGIVDLGMTSRGLSEKEKGFAAAKGIDLTMFPLALDGIALVVHRSNPVAMLDFGQLRRIFSGQVENWRDLGGEDRALAAVVRAPGSGTAALFAERLLGTGAEIVAARAHQTNEAVVADVGSQPSAIGYTSLGALCGARDRVHAIAVRAGADDAATAPTLETVQSGTYPLTRRLYLVSAGPPSEAARLFLDHCVGPAGQPLVERAGFVSAAASRQ